MKNTFKAAIIAMLAVCLLASLAACAENGTGDAPQWQTTAATTPSEDTPATTPDAPDTTKPSETTETPYTGPLMNDGSAESNNEFGDLVEG